MKRLTMLLAAMLPLSAVHAQMRHGDMKGMDMKMEKKDTSATVHRAAGTVTAVDAAKGAVTVAHGDIQSLNWPAMTMTFKLKDKSMAGGLKPGRKIEFGFVQSGKDYVVTEIK